MSKEPSILSPADLETPLTDRRFVWVTLSMGKRVCVWEMLTRDYMTVNEHARRPAIDPRGGVDPTESQAWQILVSCYGDEPGQPGAQPLFNVTHLPQLMQMRVSDYTKIMAAIGSVNSSDAEEVAALEAFMAARQAPENSPSPSGVSNSSTASRARSTPLSVTSSER